MHSKAQLRPIPAHLFCHQQNLDFAAPAAGVDEVGRGPLVGAVVAAAVILPERHGIAELQDSKKLSEKKRVEIAARVWDVAIACALGRAEPDEIDSVNILQASLLAMQRAVTGLAVAPVTALVDGNKKPQLDCATHAVVKGDNRVEEIAAASIVAKVARDQEMLELDRYYPEYGFAKHKGYPTTLHLEMLARHGVLSEHRKSFGPVRKMLDCRKDD